MPLLAFLINLILPGKQNKLSGWVSTLAILTGTICSAFVFARVWNGHQVHQSIDWFTIGTTKITAGILLNNLSVLMLLLVNLIALPVHIYSIAYMGHDEGLKRYFTYLSFFCFSMLALVVADNLVLFYIFWELVGFSSYLLIGFWYTRDRAVFANKKAFIMNRIGDIGLLTAIIIIFTQFHSFDINTIFPSQYISDSIAHQQSMIDSQRWFGTPEFIRYYPIVQGAGYTGVLSLPITWQYIAFAGILLAVAAKSAQFPLHTWLPDAMEGPTSISALIHAATMVAAGVFLLGRVYSLFNQTELTILAVVGCFTAFMGATIALAQNDLKRILAYSTISQLGYMVMAMGVGAYASSLLHLATHAFFKCLLFLVAGVVIHQMAHIRDDNNLNIDPQNIQFMGGLRKKLPFTFIVALIGGLALVGLPLTSGYLSKEGILIQAFEWSDDKGVIFKLVPFAALLTTWLTAFYVARMIIKVFFGDLRVAQLAPGLKVNIGDGHWLYKLPLALLAVCCFFSLFSQNPFSFESSWLFGGLSTAGSAGASAGYGIIPVGVTIISLLVLWFAYIVYSGRRANPFPQKGAIFNLACNEWYFDKIYDKFVIQPILVLGLACFWTDRRIIDGFIVLFAKAALLLSKVATFIDRYIIDGFINLLVQLVRGIGNFARRFQGGKVQYYLYSMLVVLLVLFILKTFI
jgi:NADH-quinone oxidoreductase subunit L